MEESDITTEYVRWLNETPSECYFAQSGNLRVSVSGVKKWLGGYQGNTSNLAFAIINSDTDSNSGTIALSNITWIHRRAEVTVVSGPEDHWQQRYGLQAQQLIIEYAFQRLGLRKLMQSALTDDTEKIQINSSLGYQSEVVSTQEAFIDDQFRDVTVMGLLKDEYVDKVSADAPNLQSFSIPNPIARKISGKSAPCKNPKAQPPGKNPELVGERIWLRELKDSDITEEYLGWLNDANVTRHMDVGRFPQTFENMESWLRQRNGNMLSMPFAIMDTATNRHIGTLTLYDKNWAAYNAKETKLNWAHRTLVPGIMIGCREFWGKGYGTEAQRLIIDYAFRSLGVHKIEHNPAADNHGSIKMAQKLGFQAEGTLREHAFMEGEFRDVIILGLFEDDFLLND